MNDPKYNFYIRIGGKTGNFNKIRIDSGTLILFNWQCFLLIFFFVYKIQLKYIFKHFQLSKLCLNLWNYR